MRPRQLKVVLDFSFRSPLGDNRFPPPPNLSYCDQPTIRVQLRHSSALPPQRTRNPRPRSSLLPPRHPDRDEMVQRFLDMYAAEFRRPGRADQPVHYREQLQTIRRESILAMTLRVEAALPTRLKVQVSVKNARRSPAKKKKKGRKAAKQKKQRSAGLEIAIPLLDLFREEFFVASANRSIGPGRRPTILARRFLDEKLSAKDSRSNSRQSARGSASGPVRRPHRHAPRSIPDGPGPPSSRQIPARTEHRSRPRPTQSLLPPPRKLDQTPKDQAH